MPSGAKRRKAAKKKKEKETGQCQGQPPSLEDSGNENEHDNVITPKTPVETNGEGGSSVEQEDVLVHSSSPPLERTDATLAVPENDREKENEVEVLSSGELHDKNGGNNPKRTIQPRGVETPTELHLTSGDETEVSSSKILLNQNESNQNTVPFTDHSSKDDAYVDTGSPSQELESSDGDEINLDIASTLAVFDTNEFSQSLGSVESRRSSQHTRSQKFPEQTSIDRAILISQDQDGISQGISETSFRDLCSEPESDHTPVFEVQIDAIKLHQKEYEKESSLFPEATKDFINEANIQIPGESVTNNYTIPEEHFCESVVSCQNIQGAVLVYSDTTNKETEESSTVQENSAKTLVVPLLNSDSSDMGATPVISTGGEVSGTTGGETRRILISTRGETNKDMISTSAEASRDAVSTGGDVNYNGGNFSRDFVSNGGEVFGDVSSTGREASGDNLGTSHVQDTSVDSKEIYNEKLHPQNGENE
ncbi:hypothetical protein KI387_016913, partial [Taxus chinensis]